METNPKVSIIVPIYGVEKYIEKCARSLFAQTLRDIEFIFVDDCTKDNSIRILESIIDDYPLRREQIKIVHHEKNKGLPMSRQTGLKYATGQYISHCDSDDWVDTTMYEEMYNTAIENNADIVRCAFVREYADRSFPCVRIPSSIYKDKYDFMSVVLRGGDLSSLCDKLVKRGIVFMDNIKYPKFNMQEDRVLIVQYAYYSNKIVDIDKPFYHYRYNQNSITRVPSSERCLDRMNQLVENSNLIFDFLEEKGLSQKFTNEIKIQKFNCREHIDSLVKERKYLKIWNETYPELTLFSFLFSRASFQKKVKYILIKSRLFHKIKIIMSF